MHVKYQGLPAWLKKLKFINNIELSPVGYYMTDLNELYSQLCKLYPMNSSFIPVIDAHHVGGIEYNLLDEVNNLAFVHKLEDALLNLIN